MDLAILCAFIGLGVVFMLYVLFKLNCELHRKEHPELGPDRSQLSRPAVNRLQQSELKAGAEARAPTVELETRRR